MDDQDFKEPCKKKRRTTTLKNDQDKAHFATPVLPGKMAEIGKGYIPLTTVRSTI